MRETKLEALERRTLLSNAVEAAVAPLAEHGGGVGFIPKQYQLVNRAGYLTAAQKGQPLNIALQYLKANAKSLGLAAGDIEHAIVTDQYTDQDTGVTHIYLRQTFNGLEVVNADLSIHVAKNGKIISVGGGFVPALKETNSVKPSFSALTAVNRAASKLGLLNQGFLGSKLTLTEARVLYELATRADITAGEIANDLQLDVEHVERRAEDDSRHDERQQQQAVQPLPPREPEPRDAQCRRHAKHQTREHGEHRDLQAQHEPRDELRVAPDRLEPLQAVALGGEGWNLLLEERQPRYEHQRQEHEDQGTAGDTVERPAAERPVRVDGERPRLRIGRRHLAEHPHDQHDEQTGERVGDEHAGARVSDRLTRPHEQAGADDTPDRDHRQMSLA